MSDTTAVAPRQADPFEKVITQIVHRGAASMATHIKPESMVRVVLTEARRNEKLRECDPTSLGLCIALCGQLGLEPTGPLGHAYLIPRRNGRNGGRMECTVIIGYKGYAELARRTGQIKRMDARVVYAGDDFRVTFGPDGEFKHTPAPYNGDVRRDEDVTHAYAWIETKDGGIYLEVLDRGQIEARRKRGASGAGSKTPWDTDYPAMARKSALRALFSGGLVPMSAELVTAIQHERDAETIDGDALEAVRTAPVTRSATQALGLSVVPSETLHTTDEREHVESSTSDDMDGAP